MAYIGNSPANTGNYQLVDDIASSFNGTLVSFALTAGGIAITPAKSGQILANINGVMQEPDDTGTDGFKVTSSNIVFSSAPASGDTFWAVYQGQNVDIGTPSDDVVDTVHIKDDAVTAAKLANAINTDIATGVTGNTTANAALPKAGGTMTGAILGTVANRLSTNGTIVDLQKDGTSVGSIGTFGGDLLVQNDLTGLRFSDSSDAIFPVIASGGVSNGNTDLGLSNALFKDLYLSGGLKVGGTGAANTLEDYEEGTFTPTLYGVSTAGSPTYTAQLGFYTKIGNVVNCTIRLQTSSIGTLNGQVRVGALPFTSDSSSNSRASITCGYGAGLGITAGNTLSGWVDNGSTLIRLTVWKTGVGTNYLDDAEWTADGNVMISLAYRT